jgi:hypothetical protein
MRQSNKKTCKYLTPKNISLYPNIEGAAQIVALKKSASYLVDYFGGGCLYYCRKMSNFAG